MLKLIKYDLKIGFSNVFSKIMIFVGLIISINIIGTNSIANVCDANNIVPDVLDYICFIIGVSVNSSTHRKNLSSVVN